MQFTIIIHRISISIRVSIIDIIFSVMVSFSAMCFYHDTYTFRVNLKSVRTYSQMHRTDKYLQHRSIIWPVWLNG